ncbi:MAG: DUF503 domain-containing protein [Syntrophomonadaceae bacterium]|jgi:uncharacterized protein YlxP (DUF503 family)
MFFLVGHVELYFPSSSSLKEKRMIVSSLVNRIRKRFNISISEVAYHELWQRTILGFSAVGSNSLEMDKFTSFIEDSLYNNALDLEVTDFSYEIISR